MVCRLDLRSSLETYLRSIPSTDMDSLSDDLVFLKRY